MSRHRNVRYDRLTFHLEKCKQFFRFCTITGDGGRGTEDEGRKTEDGRRRKTEGSGKQGRRKEEGGGAKAEVNIHASIWATCVQCCAQQRVKYKPNRPFARDRREYRRKSRGLGNFHPSRFTLPAFRFTLPSSRSLLPAPRVESTGISLP
jgi:hypothetical protein